MFKDKIFYFGSIRKLVVAFGTLFDDIHIQKRDENNALIRTIKVPFSYAPSQPFLARLQQTELKTGPYATVESLLPRMSFEFADMAYDPARKLNAIHFNLKSKDQTGNVNFQLNPVPYDINFNLNIYTELWDDSLQILEQIIPYFNPSFNVTIKEIPELGIERDIPIKLNSVTPQDIYEGDFQTRRSVIWTLSFSCKGNLFPPIRNEKLVNTIVESLYTDRGMEYKSSVVTITTEDPI